MNEKKLCLFRQGGNKVIRIGFLLVVSLLLTSCGQLDIQLPEQLGGATETPDRTTEVASTPTPTPTNTIGTTASTETPEGTFIQEIHILEVEKPEIVIVNGHPFNVDVPVCVNGEFSTPYFFLSVQNTFEHTVEQRGVISSSPRGITGEIPEYRFDYRKVEPGSWVFVGSDQDPIEDFEGTVFATVQIIDDTDTYEFKYHLELPCP